MASLTRRRSGRSRIGTTAGRPEKGTTSNSSKQATSFESVVLSEVDSEIVPENIGQTEGQIDQAHFAESFYVGTFADVAEAIQKGSFCTGYDHFIAHGRLEMKLGWRRDILDLLSRGDSAQEAVSTAASDEDRFDEVGDEFFEELYLENFPDVRDAVEKGEILSGHQHWLMKGCEEIRAGLRSPAPYVGRDQSGSAPVQELWSSDLDRFNGLAYLLLNPDVLDALGGDPERARDHWINHGRAEGRIGPGIPLRSRRHVGLSNLFERPMGINIFGPLGATSGLGTAARAMAKAVSVSGLPFDLWMFENNGGGVLAAEQQRSRKPRYRVNLLLANADLLQHVFAAYPEGHFDDAYNIAVWQWELASFRPDWIFSTDGIDEIWTNSEFQKGAISSVIAAPVINIPLPVVASSKSFSNIRSFYSIPDDAFVFLCIFDVGSTAERKNPFSVVDAFGRLEKVHPGVHLVLKYHGGRHSSGFLATLRKALRGVEHVTVISDILDIVGMDRLRASCDCFVSPHRSEGFGLNIAEFMSLGKPVIATGYSGNADFFNETVGYPIDYQMIEVKETVGPYRKGFVWANPLAASIFDQMQKVLIEPEVRQLKGRAAIDFVKSRLSLEVVGEAIVQRLDALDLKKDPPRFLRHSGATSADIRKLVQSASPQVSGLTNLRYRPLLSVIVPVYNVSSRYLKACIDSVVSQTYPFWELCLCDDGSTALDTIEALEKLRGTEIRIKIVTTTKNSGIAKATNRAIEVATGPFIVLLDNDDVLQDNALEEVVKALNKDQSIDVIYTDEDKIDPEGSRIDHFYKPDWSPEHLESVMYVLHMLVVRKSLLLSIDGLRDIYDGAQDYDLMLRLSRETDRIHHVAKRLYHWRAIPGSAAREVDAKPTALINGLAALNEHGKIKYGHRAVAEEGLLTGTFRMRRRPVDHMFVSLLILTGNKRLNHPIHGDVSMVENFVNSIFAHTTHRHFEIIVVDNSTLEPKQIQKFSQLNVTVENFLPKSKDFNYAAKANFAVSRARNENLVLLNDDMEVIRGDWLTSLLELSSDPEVGAVGARLLHEDGSIQHVGTVLGVNGGAAHLYHGYPRDFVGYNAFTHIIRNYSAVTAACLATRKSIVTEVGGFDEAFAVDYNDIDFCLKLRKTGYRVVYTPYAELYHYESMSLKRTEQNLSEVRLFNERWRDVLDCDPFYNPNLTKNGVDFAEGVTP